MKISAMNWRYTVLHTLSLLCVLDVTCYRWICAIGRLCCVVGIIGCANNHAALHNIRHKTYFINNYCVYMASVNCCAFGRSCNRQTARRYQRIDANLSIVCNMDTIKFFKVTICCYHCVFKQCGHKYISI